MYVDCFIFRTAFVLEFGSMAKRSSEKVLWRAWRFGERLLVLY